MGDSDYDYFWWAKTGWFNLVVGSLLVLVNGPALAFAVAGRPVGPSALGAGFFTLVGLLGVVKGVRERRARKRRPTGA